MDGPNVSLCASHHFIYACDCLVSAKVFCIADVWVSLKSFFLPPSCPSSRVPSFLFSTMNKTFSWKLTSIFSSSKVEKNYEDDLHLIPSPSSLVKIQKYGRDEICLRCKGKTLLGRLFIIKSLLTSPSNVLPQVNFPTNNLNFHWRWRW